MDMMRENRSSPRVGVTQLLIGLADGDRYVAGNISSGGVGFAMTGPSRLEVGDPVTVRFSIPETHEPLALSAVVVHRHYRDGEQAYYFGAAFVDVDELVQNPLERYVEEAFLMETTPAHGTRMPGF